MARRVGRAALHGTRGMVCALTLAAGTTAPGQVGPSPIASQPAEIDRPGEGEPSRAVFASPQSGPIGAGTGQAVPPWMSGRVAVPITSIDQLLKMDPAALNAVYSSSGATSMPVGKVKGRVILYPGTKLASPASRVARLMWQGKVFKNDQAMAVNRFFGLRVIKGRLYEGQSWLDGGPALILDYQGTSRIYADYRDEIREVGPGIYLGLMYSRTQPDPTFKMYFALEARR